ncbi:MAG: hypothetical protein KKE39_10585 [Bacteroidetes bacterium]|nr:hypothetical protein [Bacteroidota bacterium]MBU1374221.1 hypothetical protein [Bacteroidota bacterium]MBU1485933.1 hypothetical protein [Bacteroidota bacterium]MBU1759450.1 hypothetical protein [Bacteroidota bacterium]MBU2267010.1 hypothetical protein [Bacteroidota bacterium]
MKLKKHNYLLLIVAALAFIACNNESKNLKTNENSEKCLNSEDSLKIAFFDKYFGEIDTSGFIGDDLKSRPVDSLLARGCIENFLKLKKPINALKWNKLLETQTVTFDLKELTPWLIKNLINNADVDSLKIFLGSYNDDYLNKYRSNERGKLKNRVSVFLWPYFKGNPAVSNKSGEKVQPFNIGDLHP